MRCGMRLDTKIRTAPTSQLARAKFARRTRTGGALRVCSRFLGEGIGGKIYMPQPTLGNHIPIANDAGLDVEFSK